MFEAMQSDFTNNFTNGERIKILAMEYPGYGFFANEINNGE